MYANHRSFLKTGNDERKQYSIVPKCSISCSGSHHLTNHQICKKSFGRNMFRNLLSRLYSRPSGLTDRPSETARAEHSGKGMRVPEMTLDPETTELLIGISVRSLHQFRVIPWKQRLDVEVESLSGSDLVDFDSPCLRELSLRVQREIPCFLAYHLDGMSRVNGRLTYDKVSENAFEGEMIWPECEALIADDSEILELPRDEDCEELIRLLKTVVELRPDLEWDTHRDVQCCLSSPYEFLSLFSPEVDLGELVYQFLKELLLHEHLEPYQREREYEDDVEHDQELISKLVEDHERELLTEFRRGTVPGKYGTIDTTRAKTATKEFVKLSGLEDELRAFRPDEAADKIFLLLMEKPSVENRFAFNSIPTDPVEFEYWCLEVARKTGFEGFVTQSSGDQGIDVVVRKSELSVGIQCKRQSKPCGNKAVQEAAAGILHYRLSRALVVSTSGFTSSAEELARSCNVVLCQASDLDQTLNDIEQELHSEFRDV